MQYVALFGIFALVTSHFSWVVYAQDTQRITQDANLECRNLDGDLENIRDLIKLLQQQFNTLSTRVKDCQGTKCYRASSDIIAKRNQPDIGKKNIEMIKHDNTKTQNVPLGNPNLSVQGQIASPDENNGGKPVQTVLNVMKAEVPRPIAAVSNPQLPYQTINSIKPAKFDKNTKQYMKQLNGKADDPKGEYEYEEYSVEYDDLETHDNNIRKPNAKTKRQYAFGKGMGPKLIGQPNRHSSVGQLGYLQVVDSPHVSKGALRSGHNVQYKKPLNNTESQDKTKKQSRIAKHDKVPSGYQEVPVGNGQTEKNPGRRQIHPDIHPSRPRHRKYRMPHVKPYYANLTANEHYDFGGGSPRNGEHHQPNYITTSAKQPTSAVEEAGSQEHDAHANSDPENPISPLENRNNTQDSTPQYPLKHPKRRKKSKKKRKSKYLPNLSSDSISLENEHAQHFVDDIHRYGVDATGGKLTSRYSNKKGYPKRGHFVYQSPTSEKLQKHNNEIAPGSHDQDANTLNQPHDASANGQDLNSLQAAEEKKMKKQKLRSAGPGEMSRRRKKRKKYLVKKLKQNAVNSESTSGSSESNKDTTQSPSDLATDATVINTEAPHAVPTTGRPVLSQKPHTGGNIPALTSAEVVTTTRPIQFIPMIQSKKLHKSKPDRYTRSTPFPALIPVQHHNK